MAYGRLCTLGFLPLLSGLILLLFFPLVCVRLVMALLYLHLPLCGVTNRRGISGHITRRPYGGLVVVSVHKLTPGCTGHPLR